MDNSRAAPLPHARVLYRDADGTVHPHPSPDPAQLADVVAKGDGVLWVDVDLRDEQQFELLRDVFQFHPLALEDVRNPRTRVKLDEYDLYLFAVVRGIGWVEETPDDPYDVETYNVYLFLGKNYLVTAHAEWCESVDAVFSRVERTPESLERGPARLMHGVMDATIDEFFPLLDQLDLFIDGLEERVFATFDQAAQREIFSVKRLVLSLRRHLTPQREVFNILSNRPSRFLPAEVQLYFRDVYDHVLRITDSLDTYRDLLSSTLDSYLTQVSNRLTSATKTLSIVATFTLPFVVLSSLWGMNVAVPWALDTNAFWRIVLLQAAFAVVLLAWLRWKKLL